MFKKPFTIQMNESQPEITYPSPAKFTLVFVKRNHLLFGIYQGSSMNYIIWQLCSRKIYCLMMSIRKIHKNTNLKW